VSPGRSSTPCSLNPALIPTAIEEFLTLRGRDNAAGDRIGMFWASGNRHESAFSRADQYILDRKPNRHLAFGRGIHTCLCAPMARMEIRVALNEI
jgi:cytochrome P450